MGFGDWLKAGATVLGGIGVGSLLGMNKKPKYQAPDKNAIWSNVRDEFNRVGLSDQALSSLYDKYAPEKLQQAEEYGKSRQAIDTIFQNAMSTDPSRWAQAELDRQRQEELATQNLMDKNLLGQQASTFSQLASTYGLSGGAAERTANNLARQRMMSQQDVAMQGQLSRLGTISQDMANKQNMLMQTPSMYNQLGQLKQATDRFNIGNQMDWNKNRVSTMVGAREKMAEMYGNQMTGAQQKALEQQQRAQQQRQGFWSGLGAMAGSFLPIPGGSQLGSLAGGMLSKLF